MMPNSIRSATRRACGHFSFTRLGRGKASGAVFSMRARRQFTRRASEPIELVATLAGELLYASASYIPELRYDIELVGGLRLPVVKMTKHLER